ncbi:AzlC family ABC transporter permease [uncultured Ramlibacter sp.]|uniref:AzlC family ABC transporter permease n=1 Tax=uncultured Ramlibacter sp. TaxID=260755 RepID=UPI002617129A|nr:AzlC family ABC transporter permease [uncultured Ramlibacter sp.]
MGERGGNDFSFTRAGIRRGFLMAQPLAPGTALYGVVFGVLASERGLSVLQAMVMSAFVYSGSAQLAALQGWTASAAILPLVFTVLVINARYVLFGAAIQPWLVQATPRQAYGSLFFLGDGSWALAMREYHAGYRDAGFVFGSGVAMFIPWVGGTLVGHLLAKSVPNPAALGLDFMLVAFAAAIGISLWRGKSDLWPAAAAVAVAISMHALLPGGWYIVGAGVAAGIVGALRHGR